MSANPDALLERLAQIERLMEVPDEPGGIERAIVLALEIAAAAPEEAIAEEARGLAEAARVLVTRRKDGSLRLGRALDRLWRLRDALDSLRPSAAPR